MASEQLPARSILGRQEKSKNEDLGSRLGMEAIVEAIGAAARVRHLII
jgi:hypothetical protein